jgi:hypothetical protein
MRTELEEAMAIVANARPEDVMRIEMHRAVADVDFLAEVRRGVPGPSLAGIDPRNANIIAATEASHAAMIERDRVDRERMAASKAKAAETLAAGQSPENAHNVRQSVRAGT